MEARETKVYFLSLTLAKAMKRKVFEQTWMTFLAKIRELKWRSQFYQQFFDLRFRRKVLRTIFWGALVYFSGPEI
jgi:hypothetical protein